MTVVDPSQPTLVRATELGSFFRKPLAVMLRGLGVLGALTIVPPAMAISELGVSAALAALACGAAAWLGGQVLFTRAARLEGTGGERFPIVLAVREALRACAETAFVWTTMLSTAGPLLYIYMLPEREVETILRVMLAALFVALLGWVMLLMAHMGTEVGSALVQITNNTRRTGNTDGI